MKTLTEELIDLMTLERLEENLYRGQSRDLVGKRVFGGQVLGQALRAASHTADRPAHSLHAYFLRGGDIHAPIIYEVERVRDGKSFVNRVVKAVQHGQIIFTAMVSFAHFEEGLDYQMQEPEYTDVNDLKNEEELKKIIAHYVPESLRERFKQQRHIELRPVRLRNPFAPQPEAPSNAHYMRTHEPITGDVDELALHQALVAFCSDFSLMGTALLPHGLNFMSPSLQCASLDHVIYFHRPLRIDDWLLYDMDATVSSNARGLNFGRMWQGGKLVASTVQEGLMRMHEIEQR